MNQQEHEGFEELIRTCGRSMFRAARAVLDSDADAEDAVGEAVLRAWRAYPRLKNREAAHSWLLKITVNCAREQSRRRRREVPLEELEPAASSHPAQEPSSLWQAVQALPQDQRLAVILYYYEDMPVAETARVLGVPQGTVKSRLARGRDKLRQILKEDEYEQL